MTPTATLRGLPGPLPAGERVLWQGSPTTGGLLRRALHADLVAIYFLLLAIWHVVSKAHDGAADLGLVAAAQTLALACGALAVLAALSWLAGRTTVYTITNRRVVMRIGIALPMTINLPFATMAGAGFRPFADGTGDIPIALEAGTRVAYLHLWPHARPWRLGAPEPMLRSVPDAENVAALLGRALAAERHTEAAPAAADATADARPLRVANAR